MKKEGQTDKVIAHLLEHGYITPAIARTVYRIERLAARIYDVRKRGTKVVAHDRFDDAGTRFTRYELA